jgi:GNAT superfamily N-acetyltransferase
MGELVMTPLVRGAVPADAPAILDMAAEFYPLMGIPFDRVALGPALTGLLGDATLGRVWLAEVRARPIGYAVVAFYYSLEFGGRAGLLDELFVREPYRGRGIGRAVLAALERDCRELGARALLLEVDREHDRTRALYLSVGFEDRENHSMAKRLGGPAP